jgi:hypothetical protein
MKKQIIDIDIEFEGLEFNETAIARSKGAYYKKNNKEFSKTMSNQAKLNNENPEYKASLKRGCQERDNTYQAECNSKPEVKAKISKTLTGKSKSDEHKKALKATTTNKPGDPNWEAAHKAGLAKRDKPFHAGEYGVFQSRSEAARYAKEQGLTNALRKFETWTKTKPEEYYFIKV